MLDGGWNYRVMRHVDGDEISYSFHEVYYNKDGEPEAHTMAEVSPHADSVAELRDMVAAAFAKPVLDYKTREPIDA